MNQFEDRVHTARRDGGRALGRALRRALGRDPGRDARRLGRGHRGLPHLVVLRPPLHRRPGLRLRLRLRPAAGAVGLPPLHRARRGVRPRLPGDAGAPAARGPRGARRRSSASTSPTPASGTPASTSSPTRSIRRTPPPRTCSPRGESGQFAVAGRAARTRAASFGGLKAGRGQRQAEQCCGEDPRPDHQPPALLERREELTRPGVRQYGDQDGDPDLAEPSWRDIPKIAVPVANRAGGSDAVAAAGRVPSVIPTPAPPTSSPGRTAPA